MLSSNTNQNVPWHTRVTAAIAFGITSFIIVFTNKIVLTSYSFPSVKFLALTQCIASCFFMMFQKHVIGGPKYQNLYPAFSIDIVKQVMPLPILFFINMLSGLSATKHLNIPMFVLLRRFSIAMTLILEFYMLRKSSTRIIIASVTAMLVGALVAASDDVTVDSSSVLYILLNDIFTALQGVTLKLKMDEVSHKQNKLLKDEENINNTNNDNNESNKNSSDEVQGKSKEANETSEAKVVVPKLTADGVLFYNSLISAVPSFFVWALVPEEVVAVKQFQHWTKPAFVFVFACSMFLGFVLNYTYFWCTQVNSALTSTVVGSAKNCVSSYVGMLMGDYKYTPMNFLGVNISLFAALLYSYGEVKKQRDAKKTTTTTMIETSSSSNKNNNNDVENNNNNDGGEKKHERSSSSPPTVVVNVTPGTPTSKKE